MIMVEGSAGWLGWLLVSLGSVQTPHFTDITIYRLLQRLPLLDWAPSMQVCVVCSHDAFCRSSLKVVKNFGTRIQSFAGLQCVMNLNVQAYVCKKDPNLLDLLTDSFAAFRASWAASIEGLQKPTRALKVPEECEFSQLLQNILHAMLALYPNGSSRRKETIIFALCLCHLPNRLPYSIGSNWKFGQMVTADEHRMGRSVWAII